MKAMFYLGLFFLVFCSGQELISRTCDVSSCHKCDVQNRLTTLEKRLSQQEIEIQTMKKAEEKLQNELRVLNETVNILQTQGGYSTTKGPHINTSGTVSTTSVPYSSTISPVIREFPSMVSPSYTIPTKAEMGQEFYLLFPSSYSVYNQLMISSEKPGWAVIKIPFLGISDNVTLTIGTTYWNITNSVAIMSETGLEEKGIIVETSIPVFLHAMTVEFGQNPYISPIYNKIQLGTRYKIGAYLTDKIGIISLHNKNDVSITFQMTNNVVYKGRLYRNGDTLTISMNYLSTFHLRTQSSTVGTTIESNHPIGVFIVGLNYGTDFNMLQPMDTLGKKFISPYIGSQLNVMYITPVRSNTVVNKYEKGNNPVQPISDFKYPVTNSDLAMLISNDSVIPSITSNNFQKTFTLPPVSQYGYNFSCPLPYFYRPYIPAYENKAIILVQSNNIGDIRVNDHVVTNGDVQTSATLNGVPITQIAVTLNTSHHLHVVSQFVEVGVIISGYSHDTTVSYEYLYQCL